MKDCLKCGLWSADSASQCQHCGAAFTEIPQEEIEISTERNDRDVVSISDSSCDREEEIEVFSNYKNKGEISESDSLVEENLSLFEYFVKCLKHFMDFEGRARRKEYLGFALFQNGIIFALISFLLFAVDEIIIIIPCICFVLASLLPSLAVSVRRLHDISKSGWILLMVMIPIVGGFIGFYLAMLMCFRDSDGENEYGISPKYPDAI